MKKTTSYTYSQSLNSPTKFLKQLLVYSLALSLIVGPSTPAFSLIADGDIDTHKNGQPPFLSLGVNPNLLIVIDSSGSMYDLAYDDLDTPEFCNDDSYIPYTNYDVVETPNTYMEWSDNATYHEDEIISAGAGILYRALNDGISDGTNPGDDSIIDWRVTFAKYAKGTKYLAGDIVSDNSTLDDDPPGEILWYKATTGDNSTASDGDNVTTDTVIEWKAIQKTYAGYFENDDWYTWDTASTDAFTNYTETVNPSYTPTCDDNVTTGFFPSEDKLYSNNDICVALDSTGKIFKGFAAKGNLLNWASSSKFDVEKEILTGGKYDPVTQTLVKESRGCVGRRMIKQVRTVDETGRHQYISLAIRSGYIPKGATGPADYATDNATTLIELFEPSVDGFNFNNTACAAIVDESSSGQAQNFAKECLGTEKQNESAAASNAAFNHGFQTCWTIFKWPFITQGDVGRMANACESVYDDGVNPYELETDDSGYVCLGDYNDGSGYVGRCFIVNTPGSTGNYSCTTLTGPAGETATHPYFKNGDPAEDKEDEWILCGEDELLPYGFHEVNDKGTKTKVLDTAACTEGYVYKCPDGSEWDADANACQTTSPPIKDAVWELVEECSGSVASVPVDYTPVANYDQLEGCVHDALRDFCQEYYEPPVVDPSTEPALGDNATVQYPNLPAVFTDLAAKTQLGNTIVSMAARVPVSSPPIGVLQDPKYDNIRFGLMSFNYDGSDYECNNLAEPNRLYDCTATIKDGSAIETTAYLHKGSGHISDLADKINNLQAMAWTPMAETMFNAVGYYGQQDTMRLDNSDFSISATSVYAGDATDPDGNAIAAFSAGTFYPKGTIIQSGGELYWAGDNGTSDVGATFEEDKGVTWVPVDPVTAYCQSNNILILSDGAPTADLNNIVANFAAANAVDTGGDDILDCGSYDGSTYLDDLAYFGATSNDIFAEENFEAEFGPGHPKEKIRTFVVTTGALKTSGDEDECRADILLKSTAVNGDTTGEATTYFNGENPDNLKASLQDIFASLSTRASAGSAASVISSARGGEGAIYQAIFWPSLQRNDDQGETLNVNWVGDVHALFIDQYGYLYEDYNTNRMLDAGDRRVIIYFDDDPNVLRSRACLTTLAADGSCSNPIELADVNFIWSASERLTDLTDVVNNRTVVDQDDYISDDKRRQIFTWNDLNNDGIVNYTLSNTTNEVIDFVEGAFGSGDIDTDSSKTLGPDRGKVGYDFVKNEAAQTETYDDVDDIINWVRGQDNGTMRSRQLPAADNSATNITWRLGDIIHSTPMVVSSPAEGFHLIYGDLSYAQFYKRHQQRRQVVYFGANDGMLHAVNGGFFNTKQKKFCLDPEIDGDGNCTESNTDVPELGSELWAYVPYNLLPHLSSLTKTDYANKHKYYVDLRPRIFDAKIFTPEAECSSNSTQATDCIHPGGWGTILVGGMRFGGAPIEAEADLNPTASDNRLFTSSYFVMDITDPENPPVLLGETTQTLTAGAPNYVDLGYSTVISTMVIMKDFDTSTPSNDWYLILGSGPHGDDALKGVSDQVAKIAVLNLSSTITDGGRPLNLVDADNLPQKALRIMPTQPAAKIDLDGTFELIDTVAPVDYDSSNGFVSDPITIDYDINPTVHNYKADVVYFGTVEGDFNAAETAWDGNGTFYRLVTRYIDNFTLDSNYGTTDIPVAVPDTYPYQWQIRPLIDLPGQPVSAPASVGTDGHNFWVYFGTGRFFDGRDKTDSANQAFYGIKEPMNWNAPPIVSPTPPATFSWGKVERDKSPRGTDPGDKGLVRVDEIGVFNGTTKDDSSLFCREMIADSWQDSNSTQCLIDANASELIDNSQVPAVHKVFSSLIDYTSGYNADGTNACTAAYGYKGCVDGWYKMFRPLGNRERNLGQPTLYGGLLTYTTYQPFADECKAEGDAWLYANFYQTGTAWYKPVFGFDQFDLQEGVYEKLFLGRGLALTPNLHTGGGSDNPRIFIQTSTGEIKELTQTNLPFSKKEGRFKWEEFLR